MKPTPGPWVTGVIFNPTSPRPNVIIWDESEPRREAIARDVATKNAALISAAPDLLAVLKKIWWLACHEGDIDAETEWESVRAAIAKAEGGK